MWMRKMRFAVGRIEATRLVEHGLHRLQRVAEGGRETFRSRGRGDAAADPREQRIVEQHAQAPEPVAHRRLRQSEALRRAADAALGVDRVEDLQQVEVDVVDAHRVNIDDIDRRHAVDAIDIERAGS